MRSRLPWVIIHSNEFYEYNSDQEKEHKHTTQGDQTRGHSPTPFRIIFIDNALPVFSNQSNKSSATRSSLHSNYSLCEDIY